MTRKMITFKYHIRYIHMYNKLFWWWSLWKMVLIWNGRSKKKKNENYKRHQSSLAFFNIHKWRCHIHKSVSKFMAFIVIVLPISDVGCNISLSLTGSPIAKAIIFCFIALYTSSGCQCVEIISLATSLAFAKTDPIWTYL